MALHSRHDRLTGFDHLGDRVTHLFEVFLQLEPDQGLVLDHENRVYHLYRSPFLFAAGIQWKREAQHHEGPVGLHDRGTALSLFHDCLD
jgi:hypothetical protein